MNLKYNIKSVILSLVVLVVGLSFTDNLNKSKLIPTGIDAWDNHSIAVNFATYNKFPLMGIYKDESIYQFNQMSHSVIEDYLFCRWSQSGWVYSFEKPPLFPFLLGLVYKVFGCDIGNMYYINLFLIVFSIYLMFGIGNVLFPVYRLFLSFLSGVLYVMFGTFDVPSSVLSNTLLTTVILLTISYIINNYQRRDTQYYMSIGLCLAMMSVIKGNVIFFVLLYPVYLLFQYGVNRKSFRAITSIVIAFMVSLSPWMVYANIVRVNTQDYSREWGERLKKSEQNCKLDILDYDSVEKSRIHQLNIIQNNWHAALVTELWTDAYAKNKFIIISNQFKKGDEFLSVHNELSVNGEWKPEWRFLKEAYYNNKHIDKPVLVKIMYFYIDNPDLFLKNCYGKIKHAIGDEFSFFCLAMLLVGVYLIVYDKKYNVQQIGTFLLCMLYALFYKNYVVGIIAPVLIFMLGMIKYRTFHIDAIHFSLVVVLLNSLLFVLILYGGTRFIFYIDPLSILLSLSIFTRIYLCPSKNTYSN